MGDGRGVAGARGADSVSRGPGEVGDAGACGGSLFVTLWLVTERGKKGSRGWAALRAAHPRLPFFGGRLALRPLSGAAPDARANSQGSSRTRARGKRRAQGCRAWRRTPFVQRCVRAGRDGYA